MTPLNEASIIAHIRELFPGGETLTDDCGALPPIAPAHHLLVTTDVMEDGKHFRMDWHPPRLLGRKLLVVNLSDLDASGARPLGFTLTLALGLDLDPGWLDAFLHGLAEAAREFETPLLGGDTVGRAQGVGLGITAFGEARRWLRRDGVHVGDGIFLDQPVGLSLRGLKKLQAGLRWNPADPDADLAAHLNPCPNLGLGHAMAAIEEVHACIDLSDGLSKDLRMLAEASRLSILLETDLSPEERMGGEDYARCFASSLSQEELTSRLGVPVQKIGTAVPSGSGPLLIYDGGSLGLLPDLSFNHFEHP